MMKAESDLSRSNGALRDGKSAAAALLGSSSFRYALGALILGGLWSFFSRLLGPEILPDPVEACKGFILSLADPDFLHHGALSIARLMGGLALATVTGFPLGLWFGHSAKADWLGAPLTFITFPVPKIVLLPVFFTIVGIGDASRVLLIALTAGYQILVIVRAEALALDPSYALAFRSMGGRGAALWRHVYVPAALPSLFTSLRVAVGTAVAVLFLAESFATDAGLGWLIMDAWGMGDVLRMFTGIIALSVLGVALYAGVTLLERLFSPWLRVHGKPTGA